MPKRIDVTNDGMRVFICATGSGTVGKEGPHLSLDLMLEDEVDYAIDELIKQLKRTRIKAKKEIRKNNERGPFPRRTRTKVTR